MAFSGVLRTAAAARRPTPAQAGRREARVPAKHTRASLVCDVHVLRPPSRQSQIVYAHRMINVSELHLWLTASRDVEIRHAQHASLN